MVVAMVEEEDTVAVMAEDMADGDVKREKLMPSLKLMLNLKQMPNPKQMPSPNLMLKPMLITDMVGVMAVVMEDMVVMAEERDQHGEVAMEADMEVDMEVDMAAVGVMAAVMVAVEVMAVVTDGAVNMQYRCILLTYQYIQSLAIITYSFTIIWPKSHQMLL